LTQLLTVLTVPRIGQIFQAFLLTFASYGANRAYIEIRTAVRDKKSSEIIDSKIDALLDKHGQEFANFLAFVWLPLGSNLGTPLHFDLAYFARRRGLSIHGHRILSSMGFFLSETSFRRILHQRISQERARVRFVNPCRADALEGCIAGSIAPISN